ncbi:MAG: ABC transporter ATP-binding protein [Lachnospiraceae bacterium]|nr:ABC transporter ATP-binding protein [Lachnospiraceae bacterium]
MKRLLKYLKPHKWTMLLVTGIVIILTVLELYKPIIIGDAIDEYINGYFRPYVEVSEGAEGAVAYGDIWLSRESEAVKAIGALEGGGTDHAALDGQLFYQIYLVEDGYYMAEQIDSETCEFLQTATSEELITYRAQSKALERAQLGQLRQFDFLGICQAAVVYLVVLLLNFAFNVLQTMALQNMGQKIIYKMREDVFAHIHTLSLSFFNTQPVGKLVTRVANDTEAVNQMFTSVVVRLFKNVLKIAGYAVVMYTINPAMTGYAFLMLPIVGVVTFVFRHLSRVVYRITRNKITELNTFLSENISGMRLIQIFAREKEKYDEFEDKNKGLYKAGFNEMMIFAIFRPLIYMLSIVALVIIIGNGSSLVFRGEISLGVLFIFINYISSFFDPIQDLAEQFGTLQSSLASAEKVYQILDTEPEIKNPPQPVDVNILGRIEFKNVWFAYEKEDYILKDVSFTIEPGQKVAFVGATGAGKSSILNLIGRYYDIQKGEILVDGVNIKDLDTDVLRRAIGQVQQDVFIFTGDIKSNITLGNEAITMEQVKAAAKNVNAHTFIDKMAGGYDEPVTERGSTLSAGQRQLLSFARTLAYDPKILVLDEATANIDTETESLITEALEYLMAGRTTIMVAHRLSTIQHADVIMVMDHGCIMERGTHQELLAQDGIYKKLYELQLVEE